MGTRIIIFEDNENLRISLTSLFKYSDDYELIATYADVLDAANVVKNSKPQVVLLDIDMPKVDGISAIPIIKEADPLVSVIMYTQFEDDEKLFNSLCAGADGYILKNTSPLKLFNAIEEVKKGGVPLSPSVAKKVLTFFHTHFPSHKAESKIRYGLTTRETEVLQLLMKGYSVKLIAAKLNIAFDTARSHLRNIYHKLHVNCGKEAIAKVLSEHIKL